MVIWKYLSTYNEQGLTTVFSLTLVISEYNLTEVVTAAGGFLESLLPLGWRTDSGLRLLGLSRAGPISSSSSLSSSELSVSLGRGGFKKNLGNLIWGLRFLLYPVAP